MTDKPGLVALADAMQEAFNHCAHGAYSEKKDPLDLNKLLAVVSEYLTERRVAQRLGYVEVLVSREVVEALRMAGEPYDDPDTYAHARGRVCFLLARDLGDLLKEPSR